MTSAANSSNLNSLLEQALWELANEENKPTDPEEADPLDSLIDAARANLLGGMMPEEAEMLFSTTNGPLSTARYETIAARQAELRRIHDEVTPPPPPIPAESPSSIVDVQKSDQPQQSAVRVGPQQSAVRDEPRQPAVRNTDDDEWEEGWEDWPSDAPAVAQPPTPAESRVAAAAQRLAEERERRLQRNSSTLRNRAAEIEAEKAAEAALANLPMPSSAHP